MAFTLTSMDKFAISKNTSNTSNNSTGTESCRVTEIEFLNRGKSHSVWTEDTRPYLERVRGGLWVMGEGHRHRQRPQMNYIEVRSLRAWSSSLADGVVSGVSGNITQSIGIRDGVDLMEGRPRRWRGEVEEGIQVQEWSNPIQRQDEPRWTRVTERERDDVKTEERERVEGKQKIKLRRNGKELKPQARPW